MFSDVSHCPIDPNEINLLRRVFDRITAEARVPPLTVEAELFGASLIQMFQSGVRDEAGLLSLAQERHTNLIRRIG